MSRAIKSVLAGIFLLQTSLFGADGVSRQGYQIGEVFGIPISNSQVTSWVVAIIFVLVLRFVIIGKIRIIPGKGQAFVETIVESLSGVIKPIVGKHVFRHCFPILAAFFLIILVHNWSGLLPGVGTFGWYDEEKLTYFYRPQNSDLNNTLALSALGIFFWLYFSLRYAGPKTFFLDVFGNKADKKQTPAFIYYALFPMFIAVGFIELISFSIRPVSLSLRLFGNIFGGETLLDSMITTAPWIVPIPFYFFEFMVGLVQALVFTLLLAVYIGLICNHGDDEHAH